jgi:hypothetical protein
MTTGRNGGAGRDSQAGGYAGGVVGPTDLPATNVHSRVAVVVEFDELVVGATGPARPELANEDRRCWCG